MTTGVKNDQGKPRIGLMMHDFSRALTEISRVTTFGAEKYAPSNWLLVENAQERYADAMYRHLLASAIERVDSESGLSHIAHAAWNALAILELEARRT